MAQPYAERDQQRVERYQQRVLADGDEERDSFEAPRPDFKELSLRGRSLAKALARRHPQDPLRIDSKDPDEAYHQ